MTARIGTWARQAPREQVIATVAAGLAVVVLVGASAVPHKPDEEAFVFTQPAVDTTAALATPPGFAPVDGGVDDPTGSGDADVLSFDPDPPGSFTNPIQPAVAAPDSALGAPTDGPSTTAPAPSPPTAPTGRSGDQGQELLVTETLWATRQAGTPVAAVGVPEGALPIGVRLGQTDKASYLRFDGHGLLTLAEDPDGTRSPPAGEITLQACQILDADWHEGEAASFEDAPGHDVDDCSSGVRDADGTWTFDLADHDGSTGVALVPGADAPVDFQVSLNLNG